ncbi:MAG: PAS domain S-box protein, partial [Lentisphaeria bacterium]
ALQAAGLLLIVLRGAIPDWMSMVTANTLVVTGAILGYAGLGRFVGKKTPQTVNGLLLVVFVLVQLHLAVVHPCLWGRSLNVAVALFIICAQCLWLLRRRAEPAMRPLTRWVGVVFGGYCLLFTGRILFLLAHADSATDYFHGGMMEALFLMAVQMLFILLTYAVTLMVNQRLNQAIALQEEKFSKAFHSSPYAICLTRLADGTIFEVNDGFQRITGYPPAELMEKTTAELRFWTHPAARTAMVDELMAKGSVHGLETQFTIKSGEEITGLFSAEIITINHELCILSSINDITGLKRAEAERERLVQEREKALSEVKVLSGLLPICAACKKIRDDHGQWNPLELYVHHHSEARFSHGLCPDCARKLYPELGDEASPADAPPPLSP